MAQDLFKQLEDLKSQLEGSARPVSEWNPPLCGDIDIRVGRDGQWYHEGTRFERQPLVDLFASILKREGDDFFLVTPVEKWRIQVDDAPLSIGGVARKGEGATQVILASTTTGDVVQVDAEHPLRVEFAEDGEPAPYIHVRDGLDGKIQRAAFYELVDWAEREQNGGLDKLVIHSAGNRFLLGKL
ncbi:DUF1285 domain-containing protein [Biformimicrobium ophioploci]|uniref:DUF1285 domain-containing protein n=1 Tax=Biformimicrobium ophioploci TaxID=3036711 RepID=A0ABQ6M1M1_9GAMM|nr:DUF1285 domain-containing protein [Microbulbifer sp. NKW57]GMG88248.1 DUF1285 domain-containing protein [Microbulbifer sp. NKW57]